MQRSILSRAALVLGCCLLTCVDLPAVAQDNQQETVGRFSIDFYIGLGPRYRKVVQYDRLNPEDILTSPRHPNVHYYQHQAGAFRTCSIPCNIRIGYRF